jgi:antagonist of KipI
MTAGAFEVVEPGLLTTVQDAGRVGWEHLGVPHAGACDRWGLAVANALLDNPADAAALEMTLVGPTLRARGSCAIALGGADLGAEVVRTGVRLGPGTTHTLRDGDVLRFPGGGRGMRGYLAVPGGFDVPLVLGSRSTYLAARLGGLDGRALETGDVLAAVAPADDEIGTRPWPDRPSLDPDRDPVLRVVDGPDAEDLPDVLEALLGATWVIDEGSDRTGVRLRAGDGGAIPDVGQLVSRPVTWGAIQVPPSGAPIILGADHQTVGGYAVPAVVITADLPVLAQLRPGSPVGFVRVSMEDAIEALRDRSETFRHAADRTRSDRVWHDLWLNTAG